MKRPLIFRCSSVGKLMGNARTKGETLSDTAKAYVREVAAQDILGIDFEISGKPLEKGIEVEPDIVALINEVRGLSLVKNTERRTDAHLTGECDLFDAARRIGRDAKAAWSAQTFPIVWEDVNPTLRTLYEWQDRAYMRLWDATEWWTEYGLVDTPERLIGYEPLAIHIVNHIPAHLRLTGHCFKRDLSLEAEMIEKIEAAREYYAKVIAEFDRTHPSLPADPLGDLAPTPTRPTADMDAPWGLPAAPVDKPRAALAPADF